MAVDPTIAAAGISALANIGGGFMSAGGAAAANAQNAAINQQNIAAAQQQWNQQQTFQNNVNVANWAYQDKVNQENFDFAREQTARSEAGAANQMAFQERMSSTAYQRAMADMRAAGLNPILAYQQGGASTPSGAMGNVQNASASSVAGSGTAAAAPRASISMVNTQDELGRAVGRAASSAVDAYRTTEDAKLKSKQQDLTDAQNTTEGFRAYQVKMDAAQRKEATFKTEAETENEKLRSGLIKAQVDMTRANSAASYADAAYRMGQKAYHDQYGYPGSPGSIERFGRNIQDLSQHTTVPALPGMPNNYP